MTIRLIPDRSPENPTQQSGVAAVKPGQDDLFALSASPQATVERGPALLLATAKGLGFRFEPNVEETTRNGRKIARLSADDEVITVQPVNSGRTVCATASGYLLAFPTEEITELSGAGRGVILIRLDTDDRLVGAVTSEPGAGGDGYQ